MQGAAAVSRAKALTLMVMAPVLWSTAGVVTRHMSAAGGFEQVFWRSLFAFLFVLGVMLFKKQTPTPNPLLFVSGALWAVMFTTFVLALSLTTIANTLVVMSVSPLLTAFLARLVLKEPVQLRTWVAAAAAGLGIAWMAASGVGASGVRDIAGMLVALTVPVASATNFIVLRAAARREPGRRVDLVPAVMLGGLVSCLLALPLALPLRASAGDLARLAFLGFFQLGLPCMLMVVASRVLAAPEIALIGLLEVVLGTLWAWLFAGETPAAATLSGGGLVLAALAFNEVPWIWRIMASKLSVPRISG